MITATEIKAGNFVRLGNDTFKVIESVTHTGGGKAGSMVHAKLKNVATGHATERRFATDDKVEDLPVTRTKMQFLYKDGDAYTFMNPETYDQIPLDKNVIGAAATFLKENDEIEVQFHEDKPLAVVFQSAVELSVTSTGAPLQGITTPKEATLENGMQVLVPQFIKEGDHIRVEVESGKYLDRVMDRETKGAKFTVAAPPTKEGGEKNPEAREKSKEK